MKAGYRDWLQANFQGGTSTTQFSEARRLETLDGTGTAYKTGYLHFQLQNCGANIPNVTAGNFIVQDSFDLRPSSLNGPISGSIIGNDQILCGQLVC